MKVVVKESDFGHYVDVYFVGEGVGETIVYPSAIEGGQIVWTQVTIQANEILPDDIVPLRISRPMYEAMRDAFTRHSLENPPSVDFLIQVLKKEQNRVDKLLDFAITPPMQITEIRER